MKCVDAGSPRDLMVQYVRELALQSLGGLHICVDMAEKGVALRMRLR